MQWENFDRGVFLVNVLGIVFDKKSRRILIGRVENDPHIKELSWRYPGGRPGYEEDLERYLKLEVKKKTNLNVRVKQVIHARSHSFNRKMLVVYFYCEVAGGKVRAGEKFVEIRWIKPGEIQKYFSKSAGKTPKPVYDFLLKLK